MLTYQSRPSRNHFTNAGISIWKEQVICRERARDLDKYSQAHSILVSNPEGASVDIIQLKLMEGGRRSNVSMTIPGHIRPKVLGVGGTKAISVHPVHL